MKLLTKIDLKPIFEARVDQKDYTLKRYFHPWQKIPYLARFKLVLRLLNDKKFDNFLDIGFGSGIFFPELNDRCNNLYGVDLHPEVDLVKNILTTKNISVNIQKADLVNLPYENNFFNGILALSVLEFVPDISKAITEIKRVAKTDSTIMIGAPIMNPITNFMYKKIIRFKDHQSAHKTDHNQIISAIKKEFEIIKILKYPSFFPLNYSLFFVLKAKNTI